MVTSLASEARKEMWVLSNFLNVSSNSELVSLFSLFPTDGTHIA